MDLSVQYCPIRRNIEEHCWSLTSRLFQTTTSLMKSIGGDHLLFLTTQSECRHTREELAVLRDQLQLHRRAHGC